MDSFTLSPKTNTIMQTPLGFFFLMEVTHGKTLYSSQRQMAGNDMRECVALLCRCPIIVSRLFRRFCSLSSVDDRLSSFPPSARPASRTTVDTEELRRFHNLASKWWDELGEFAALHSMNDLRVPFIRCVCTCARGSEREMYIDVPIKTTL